MCKFHFPLVALCVVWAVSSGCQSSDATVKITPSPTPSAGSTAAGPGGAPPSAPNPIYTSISTTNATTSATSTNDRPAQRRTVSVGGRTVIDIYYDVAGALTPLGGVKVYAIVDGVRKDVISDGLGFWALSNIPTRATGGANDPANNLVIYFEADGFETASRNVDLLELTAAAEEVPSSTYQIDLGRISLVPQVLRFKSNVVRVRKDGANNYSEWVGSNETIGGNAADVENIYLSDGAANITLTFNLPVDTTRAGTQFLTLLDPRSVLVPYTGSWNSSGTVFTVDPTSNLTASQIRTDKFSFAFKGAVYPGGTIYRASSLSGTTVKFNVANSALLPVVSQAPTLAPEAENANYLSYTFDHNKVYANGIVTTGGANDVVANGTLFAIRYNVVPGQTNKIYVRNVPAAAAASAWGADRTADCTIARYPDATETCVFTVDIFAGYTSTGTLKDGEKLEIVVTSIKGGEESDPFAVTPLSIADQKKPFVAAAGAATWAAATSAAPRLEIGASTVTGRTSVTYSEPMGNASPAYAVLSGGLASVTQTGTGRWASNVIYGQDVTLTFNVPSTTLAQAHVVGDTKLKVASASSSTSRFTVGDKIVVGTGNSQYRETRTITAVDTYNNLLTVGVALSNNHASGVPVLLLDSATTNPGLTSFASTVATAARAGSSTIALASGTGSRFYAGQGINVFRLDPSGATGFLTEVGATILSIAGDTLTLSAPLSAGAGVGAVVLDSNAYANVAALKEAGPRASVTVGSTGKVLFDSSSGVVTTTTANQSGAAPDAKPDEINVTSTAGIYVGDTITIDASPAMVADPITVAQTDVAVAVVVTDGTKFAPGDVIEFTAHSDSVAVAAASTTTARASGTTLTLSAAHDVRKSDLLRFYEAPAVANVTVAVASAAAANQALTVNSTAGFAVGQVVKFDDRVTGSGVDVTVVSIVSANVLWVDGLTATQVVPVGALLKKAEMKFDATSDADTAGASVTLPVAFPFPAGIGFSETATVTHIRRERRATVTVVAGNTLTIAAGAGGGFPSATTVKVVSEPETFVVKTLPSSQSLILNGNLRFSHRAGVNVTKVSQATLLVSVPANLNTVMVGDTVVIEPETGGQAEAKKDRFSGTVLALDTALGLVTLTTTQTGYYDFNALGAEELKAMGDAVSVTGAIDSSGNGFETAHGYRVCLKGGNIGR